MAKLSNKKITDLVSELKWGEEDLFNPEEGNFPSIFYENKTFFIYALLANGKVLKYASDEFKSDKELVKIAVNRDMKSFEFASENLRNDREFILELAYFNNDIIEYVPEKFQLDEEFRSLFPEYENIISLENAPEGLKNDKEFVLKVMAQQGMSLNYVTEEFKNDIDVILTAVKNNPRAFKYVPDELKSNKEVLATVLSENGEMLGETSKEIQSDREMVKLAVKNFGGALAYADKEFCSDKELVLLAINSRYNIDDAYGAIARSSDLLSDKEFVTQLLYLDDDVWNHLGDSLKKDADLKLLYKIKTA